VVRGAIVQNRRTRPLLVSAPVEHSAQVSATRLMVEILTVVPGPNGMVAFRHTQPRGRSSIRPQLAGGQSDRTLLMPLAGGR
jgi:hypothetical protein